MSTTSLKIEQALQQMRKGACLAHMHGRTSDPYHWFVMPGGPVTDSVAAKILEHPSVVGGKDGLLPGLDQTWRMLDFVEAAR
jgi:hypothetical protein